MNDYFKIFIAMTTFVCSFYFINSYLFSSDINDKSIIEMLNGNLLKRNINAPLAPFSVYDYPHPVITKHEELCNTSPSFQFIFLIKSYIKNLDARMAIRETWGLDDPYPEVKTRHVFLMGVDYNNDSVRLETLRENEIFGDIILADYQDEYDNNSIKDVMGFNWAKTFCPNSKFYILADDDAYISVNNLLKYLNKNVESNTVNKAVTSYPLLYQAPENKDYSSMAKFIGGFVHNGAPIRKGKWNVSMEEYPYDKYPVFPIGHCVVISRSALNDLIEAAKYTKFYKLDDVYLGFLALYAGLKISKIPEVYNRAVDVKKISRYDKIISSHYISPQDLRKIHDIQKQKGNA